MRECWINVYPCIDVNNGHYLGVVMPSRGASNAAATSWGEACNLDREFLGKALRAAGVGYRLHVRLKGSALPVTDALAAGKASQDERRSA